MPKINTLIITFSPNPIAHKIKKLTNAHKMKNSCYSSGLNARKSCTLWL